MSLFNTIFLGNTENRVRIVRHEWGHTVQQAVLGTHNFLFKMAIPSLAGTILGVDNYFSQPWERSADFLGGTSDGPYIEGSELLALWYFILAFK